MAATYLDARRFTQLTNVDEQRDRPKFKHQCELIVVTTYHQLVYLALHTAIQNSCTGKVHLPCQ